MRTGQPPGRFGGTPLITETGHVPPSHRRYKRAYDDNGYDERREVSRRQNTGSGLKSIDRAGWRGACVDSCHYWEFLMGREGQCKKCAGVQVGQFAACWKWERGMDWIT